MATKQKLPAYKKWWNNLSHKDKWNLTVNYMVHYSELADSEIEKIFNNPNKWAVWSHIR